MCEKMTQQVMTAPGQIIFREVPIPEPEQNQVLVRIQMIGICGSDIHVYHGEHPFTAYPVTQGHEVSGDIVALGKSVSGLFVGQKVTIEPQVFCGNCYPCTHGKYNLCEELKVMGFQITGTASTYFAVDASKVTPIPQDMPFEEGLKTLSPIEHLGEMPDIPYLIINDCADELFSEEELDTYVNKLKERVSNVEYDKLKGCIHGEITVDEWHKIIQFLITNLSK